MKIGVCARIKNEQKTILDWINHYKKLGFDKIFIYDNMSNPSIENQLNENNIFYENIIIKEDKNPRANQFNLYCDCVTNNKDLDWILLIDGDEFLDIRVNKTIKEFLSTFEENVSTIIINWVCYGTSKKENYDLTKHIFEQFTMREEYGNHWNNYIKSFVRPKFITKENIHVHKTVNKNYLCKNVYNETIEILNKPGYQGPCFVIDKKLSNNTPMILAHFMTLDYRSMLEKRERNGKYNIGFHKNCIPNKYTKEWYNKNFKDNIEDKRMIKYII